MARLTNKQRVFVEEYLQCWNATEAARRAGYKNARRSGPENVSKRGVQAKIAERLAAKAMDADEVLARLGDQARGDLGDFLHISSEGVSIDLSQATDKTHLLKKVRSKKVRTGKEEITEETTIELYDAQAALEKIGRAHGLFKQVIRAVVATDDISNLTNEEVDARLDKLFAQATAEGTAETGDGAEDEGGTDEH